MTMRAATEDDFEEMTALLVEDESWLLGRPSRIGVADLRQWIALCDLATDTWLVEDGDPVNVGQPLVRLQPEGTE